MLHHWTVSVPSVAKKRAGKIPSITLWPSETFSICPPTPGQTRLVTRVAAQSLVSSYSWQPKMSPVRLPPPWSGSHVTILTLSLQYQLIRKTMEKRAKRKLTTIVILLNKNFLLKLDPTLKVLKVADIHKCQIWLFTIVWSVSDTCWPANSRYYRLHLLFYQLPLRQITLSSHHHDQSRLWAALASGRTRSFLSHVVIAARKSSN